MKYLVLVEDEEMTSGVIDCGADIINTAFTSKGGKSVSVMFEAPLAPRDAVHAFAEVVFI